MVEMDGSMIPTVTTEARERNGVAVDRRTTRKLGWQEARLGMARTPENPLPTFGVTFGSVDEAGEQLLGAAIKAGLGQQTHVHGVGDGAPWIAEQIDKRIGKPGAYLIDFYHLCEYLAAASAVCAPADATAWLTQQKKRLKRNHLRAVLNDLRPFLEVETVDDTKSPVRAAYRYIHNRMNQLDFKGALAAGLPIGSGEIESAHRYIIQQRLKRPGGWWTVEKAWEMLALRVLRENQDWPAYWQSLSHKAA